MSATSYETLLACSCRANADRMCLGMRNTETCGYDWLTYDQVRHCVDLIGSGLAKVSFCTEFDHAQATMIIAQRKRN
jgi:hypothetical protein